MEKEFIYYSRGTTAHNHMLSLISRGIVPMISVESLGKSRVYKKCDKWLLSNGYRRVYAERSGEFKKFPFQPNIVLPARYEYHKN